MTLSLTLVDPFSATPAAASALSAFFFAVSASAAVMPAAELATSPALFAAAAALPAASAFPLLALTALPAWFAESDAFCAASDAFCAASDAFCAASDALCAASQSLLHWVRSRLRRSLRRPLVRSGCTRRLWRTHGPTARDSDKRQHQGASHPCSQSGCFSRFTAGVRIEFGTSGASRNLEIHPHVSQRSAIIKRVVPGKSVSRRHLGEKPAQRFTFASTTSTEKIDSEANLVKLIPKICCSAMT